MLTVLNACAVGAWGLFCTWYTIRAKWWRKPLGRNIFGVSFVLFLVLLWGLLNRTISGFHENMWISAIVYVAAAWYGLQRLIQMEGAQRERNSLNSRRNDPA